MSPEYYCHATVITCLWASYTSKEIVEFTTISKTTFSDAILCMIDRIQLLSEVIPFVIDNSQTLYTNALNQLIVSCVYKWVNMQNKVKFINSCQKSHSHRFGQLVIKRKTLHHLFVRNTTDSSAGNTIHYYWTNDIWDTAFCVHKI